MVEEKNKETVEEQKVEETPEAKDNTENNL